MNRYDVLLVLLITSLAGGLYGGAFVAARFLAILFFPILIARMSRCGYIKSFISFFIIFYAYCLVSMLWTPDRVQGAKELVYWIVHFVYLCEILVFAGYANKPLKSISWGWTLMIFLCSVVAGWELLTNGHLPMAVDMPDTQKMAAVTFGNRNSYITALCFSLPWIAYLLFRMTENSFIEKSILYFAVLMSIMVLVFNSSRGGLLSFCVMAGVGVIVYRHSFMKNGFKTLVALCFVVAGCALLKYSSLLSVASMSARGGLLHDTARISIWATCLQLLYESAFLGVGVGGMIASLQAYYLISGNEGVASAHNMFVEILMQYGVVWFVLAVLWLIVLFVKSWNLGERDRRAVLLMSLFAMPVYTIIDSGYLLSPQLFALMGSIYVFVNADKMKVVGDYEQ